jgi:hypothetical protein
MHSRFLRSCISAFCAGQLLFASSCIGGQTTVPSSGPPEPCERPSITREIDRRFFGVHELHVTWTKSMGPGDDTASEGALQLTLDLSRLNTSDSTAGCPRIEVRVELSSDTGALEYSGQGTVRTGRNLRIELDPAEGLFGGSITLADPLQVQLRYRDGTTLNAQGTPPP